MNSKEKPKGYWTKERCQEEALKYESRLDFAKNSGGAYYKASKNNWLNDICSHMKSSKKWFVYIVESSDGIFYTGITTDVKKRIKTHNKGKGSKLLRGSRLPVYLKWCKECGSKSEASKEEYRIKHLSKKEKENLF